jgi:hypothetical protein
LWAETRPEAEPNPTAISHSRAAQPAHPRPRSVKRSQSRGSRPHDAAPDRARPANPDPDPNLAGVRSCLPRTPPQLLVSFLHTVTTKYKRENYPQRNLSWDFPQIRNKRVTNLRFGWRGSPGQCSARAGLFGLQMGAPEHPHEHFSPLPLPLPNRATSAVPTRSLPRRAKPRRGLFEPLRCRRS